VNVQFGSGCLSPRDTHKVMVDEIEFVVDKRYVDLVAVGGGSYGLVASARDTVTGENVAIKRVANAFRDVRDAKNIVREIMLLRFFMEQITSKHAAVNMSRNKCPNVIAVQDIMVASNTRKKVSAHGTEEVEVRDATRKQRNN
jgi:hypothetical protein